MHLGDLDLFQIPSLLLSSFALCHTRVCICAHSSLLRPGWKKPFYDTLSIISSLTTRYRVPVIHVSYLLELTAEGQH